MTVKELRELLKLLRSEGVQTFKDAGTEIHLFEDKPPSNYKRKKQEELPDEERELTPEELLYYSAISPLEQQS